MRLCEARRERRTAARAEAIRQSLPFAIGWREDDVLTIGTAGDGRRAAETDEVRGKLVDASDLSKLEDLAGTDTVGVNRRRNATLREHVVADRRARRGETPGLTIARTIVATATEAEGKHDRGENGMQRGRRRTRRRPPLVVRRALR